MYISSHIFYSVPLMQKLEKFISGFTEGNISPLFCKHSHRTTVYYFRGARGRYSTRQEQGQAGSSLCMCESVSEKSAWVFFVVVRFVLQLSAHKPSAGLSETLVSTSSPKRIWLGFRVTTEREWDRVWEGKKDGKSRPCQLKQKWKEGCDSFFPPICSISSFCCFTQLFSPAYD